VRTRGLVAMWIAGSLVLSACSSDPDDGTLDLPDEGAAAPEAVEPPVEATDDPNEPEAEEPLYPPLPALEPDPTSDVPVQDQEVFLDLHARVYEATQQAAADPQYELEKLSRLLAGEALEEIVETVENLRADELVSLSPDASVPWVNLASASGGAAVVEECRVYGPRTGLYRDGELVTPAPAEPFIVQVRYGLSEVDGSVGTYAIEVGVLQGGERCGG
jgi:hypothetical protein